MNEEKKDDFIADRRRFVRMTVGNIIDCQRFSAENFSNDGADDHLKAVIKNISTDGILFESTAKFEIGELLQLTIDIPGWEKFKSEFYKNEVVSSDGLLVVLANVVRIEVLEPEEKYDIGVCVSAIDEGHKWALLKYIKRNSGASQ